jgi:hypothetical protein
MRPTTIGARAPNYFSRPSRQLILDAWRGRKVARLWRSTLQQSYCVQGNTLHILDVDTTTNMGPMGQATIVDDATYTKQ